MKIFTQSTFDTWPLDDKSCQSIITSIPYFGLRKYDIPDMNIPSLVMAERLDMCKSGMHAFSYRNLGVKCRYCGTWKGQYGLEPSYRDYIEHTRLWAKEAWRVLKDDGIFFLNIGDTYSGSGGAGGDYNKGGLREGQPKYKQGESGLPAKCKMLIPHRVAIALLDDGWILRNDIVWAKNNAMPESCKDRFSKKFEYIFMFVKKQKYYFDLDAVREPHKDPEDVKRRILKEGEYNQKWLGDDKAKRGYMKNPGGGGNKVWLKGKNVGDVWQINTQPSTVKHYATWPSTLVERMILCSTKIGDTVLDPFCGSGTTLRVAETLNRDSFGIDLGYNDIQDKRLKNIQKELPIERN